MVTDLSLVVGPVLGGVIVGTLGWRWIFLVNVPVGVGATIAGLYALPRLPARTAGKLDIGGVLRLSPGVLMLVLALAQAQSTGRVLSARALVPLVLGCLLVGDFTRHALHHASPLLDLRLYRRRTFAFGTLSLFCFDVAWFGSLFLLSLYLQEVRHLTPSAAGLNLMPEGLGIVTGLWWAGRLRHRVTARWIGAAGVATFALVVFVFTKLGPGASDLSVLLLLFVAGLAGGCVWVPATAAGYFDLSPSEISHASPIVAVMMRLGAAVGTSGAAITLQQRIGGSGSVTTLAHLVAGYRGSFAWTLPAAGAALICFFGLALAERPRADPKLSLALRTPGNARSSNVNG
jgi:predicted MFS family arabinose efflux permease